MNEVIEQFYIDNLHKNGLLLEFVENQTDEICKIVLKNNYDTIKYCKIKIDFNELFDKVIEKEIDECLFVEGCPVCGENKEFYCQYTCNDKHFICSDCGKLNNKCYYRCLNSKINFDFLYLKKN